MLQSALSRLSAAIRPGPLQIANQVELAWAEHLRSVSNLEEMARGVRLKNVKGLRRGESPSEPDRVEALAIASEAAHRGLGMKPFQVQQAAAHVLGGRAIAEMQTGEGKTLAAAIAAGALCLLGQKVRVATVNEYLAERDADTMGALFVAMGLSVSCLSSQQVAEEKQRAYRAHVVYATASELAFDYLRDNLVSSGSQRVQKGTRAIIIDEIDSILIDEATTPIVLSGKPKNSGSQYTTLAALAGQFREELHFDIDWKDRVLTLTEEGSQFAEELLASAGLLSHGDSLYNQANLALAHRLNSTLTATHIYRRDTDYLVENGAIMVVDANTGRTLAGRRWAEGVHQALEAKEGLPVQEEAPVLASITYQSYLSQYTQVSGLTGTAIADEEEFRELYGLPVVVIPTRLPCARIDDLDRLFASGSERDAAVVNEVIKANERGQPVLLGTNSVDESERIAHLLRDAGYDPSVLNAKNHALEAWIIARAGKPGAITIATQMAGRGTDILLGGAVVEDAQGRPGDFKGYAEDLALQREQVVAAGGLYVIGTSRGSSRRVDQQLRGRAGRQGDPGRSCFFISLEDEFIQTHAGDKLKGLMQRLGVDAGEALEGKMMDRIVRQAQQSKENVDREARKGLLKFDSIISGQREAFYGLRRTYLKSIDSGESLDGLVNQVLETAVDDLCRRFITRRESGAGWLDIESLMSYLRTHWSINLHPDMFKKYQDNADGVEEYLMDFSKAYWKHRESFIPDQVKRKFVAHSLLEGLDTAWREHLENFEIIRDGIHLRSFARENLYIALQRDTGKSFQQVPEQALLHASGVLMGTFLPGAAKAA